MIRQLLDALRGCWLDFWRVPPQAVAAMLLVIAALGYIAYSRVAFGWSADNGARGVAFGAVWLGLWTFSRVHKR